MFKLILPLCVALLSSISSATPTAVDQGFEASPGIFFEEENQGDSVSCDKSFQGCDIALTLEEIHEENGCFIKISVVIKCGETTCKKARKVLCHQNQQVTFKCAGKSMTIASGANSWGAIVAGEEGCDKIFIR